MKFDENVDINEYINELYLNGETWKPVNGYEKYYQISNYGRIKSLARTIIDRCGRTRHKGEKILRLSKDKNGYLISGLCVNSKSVNCKAHRLVAEAFLDNPNGFLMINHIDENKSNNSAWNLEWCNSKYNNNYGSRVERSRKTMTENPNIRRYGKDNPFYGKHHTEKTKRLLSIKNIGRNKGSNHAASVSVMQFTLNGEYLTTYGSIAEAAIDNGIRTNGHISTCISGKTNQCGGFIWIRKDEFTKDLLYEKVNRIKNPRTSQKTIYQYDKNNSFIKKYPSITIASKETGINAPDITTCARGRIKSAGGFVWKYGLTE